MKFTFSDKVCRKEINSVIEINGERDDQTIAKMLNSYFLILLKYIFLKGFFYHLQ